MSLACNLILAGALHFEASAVSDYEQNALNASNTEQDARERQIQALYDERRELINQETPDLVAICEVETQMHELGVDFLSYEQVKTQFPDANYENATFNISLDTVMPNATVPSSSVNSWSTYRVSNYYYEGQYFNIQKLVAEPISESSSLWEEGQRAVSFSVDWVAGVTNLLTVVAETAAGAALENYSWVLTVYDALKGLLEGITTTTEIRPSDVLYWYETQTTAIFAYTKIEGQPDSTQKMNHISTKSATVVGYLVDAEAWRVNGSGAWVVCPSLGSGSCSFVNTPLNYGSSAWAAYMYLYEPTLVRHDTVDSITLKAPGDKTIGTIYPCKPQFPAHCE